MQSGRQLNGGAYTGVTEGETPFGPGSVRVAAKFHGEHVLIFNAYSQAELPDQLLFETVESARSLTMEERKLSSNKKIKLVRAKSGDTFAALAKTSSLDKYAVDQLRLINGKYPDGEPTAGQLIKIIQ